ncbi:hypothetical protein Tco_0886429 [Tanacetum coccineum]
MFNTSRRNEREESKKRRKKKKIFGVLITQNPAAVFRRSLEFAPSDRHDFWTEASLHIKEGFDRWDLDFEAWKFYYDDCCMPLAVGSLMYDMVCTRPDLAHAVGVVCRFLSNPGKKHWEAVKWIFRYLRGTSKLGITFGNGKPMLVGYTDSDLAGNKDNMKSTSGYLMTFAGGAVSWQSRLQKCVALSTTKAEYVAATECYSLIRLEEPCPQGSGCNT